MLTSKTRNTAVTDSIIGFTGKEVTSVQNSKATVPNTSAIQVARAWDAALAPTKSIPMNAMMLYMSGNSVQIFSMMGVYMMVANPIRGIANIESTFAPFRSTKHSLAPQMILFVLCQLFCIGIALYKCWSMGLLPTEPSDWLAWHKAAPVRMTC
ncbi:hypothetical protein MCUN1_001285 [Malassezia cuniculi]|uniref:ER membrane protein complex subunit 4 n=1 Tax=Malassezia cuniculi TaxID=948313 RepID=A0AAF0ETL5_9BASI|nr:hypothetical protein MCUN1_001285 [Malassezia cuniculi]